MPVFHEFHHISQCFSCFTIFVHFIVQHQFADMEFDYKVTLDFVNERSCLSKQFTPHPLQFLVPAHNEPNC